jgi:hypothetical protein
MTTRAVARRTVAFFFLKSVVNFVAVAVVGTATWLGVSPYVPVRHRQPRERSATW